MTVMVVVPAVVTVVTMVPIIFPRGVCGSSHNDSRSGGSYRINTLHWATLCVISGGAVG